MKSVDLNLEWVYSTKSLLIFKTSNTAITYRPKLKAAPCYGNVELGLWTPEVAPLTACVLSGD